MTAPITAGRTGGISFRLFGIPITLHVTFVVVITFLGLGVGSVDRLAVWAGVATASVLLHELGHGLVGRLAGLQPRIDLAGFGGVTSWSQRADGHGRGELSRGWSLAISLAGPGIGFVGAAIAYVLGAPCCLVPFDASLGTFAAGVFMFASVAWGVLNLLPILPLDGGQAMRELLPGDRRQRLKRAALVGAVVGGALTAWALLESRTFLALLAGWITWNNVQQVTAARTATGPAATGLESAMAAARDGDLVGAAERAGQVVRGPGDRRRRAAAAGLVVRWLLVAGHDREAYRTATDPRLDVTLPPDLLAAVLARHPDTLHLDDIARRWARSGRADDLAVGAAVLAAHGHHGEAIDLLVGGPAIDVPTLVTVQTWAHADGDHAAAYRLATHALTRQQVASSVLAYNAGCAAARLDRPEEAVGWLSRALQLGFDDLEQLASDDDLVRLHDHPAWPLLVQGTPPPAGRGSRR